MFEPRLKDGKRRYRCWAGSPNGSLEDPRNCICEVPDGGRSCLFRQCQRRRGHGLDGLYCKQHAKMAAEQGG